MVVTVVVTLLTLIDNWVVVAGEAMKLRTVSVVTDPGSDTVEPWSTTETVTTEVVIAPGTWTVETMSAPVMETVVTLVTTKGGPVTVTIEVTDEPGAV